MKARKETLELVLASPGSATSLVGRLDRTFRIFRNRAFGRESFELWCGRSRCGITGSTRESVQRAFEERYC